MQEVNAKQLKDMIKFVAFEMNEPLMVWGQPGIGKSEISAQVADDMNAHFVDVRLSMYEAVDLRGIPDPDADDKTTVWYAPATLPFKGNPAFEGHERIYLFLDEINSAAPSVSAVAYQLINDRRVGEHELRDNVVVVAAGNREGDKGVVNRMPTPLANRFIHVELGVSVEAWAEDYAVPAGLPPEGIAFMHFRPNLLSTFDPSKPDKAFATPRSWTKAFKAYRAANVNEDVRYATMTGSVGDGPATEFWAFVEVWSKMITMDQILDDPKGVEFPADDAAMKFALATQVSGHMDTENVKPCNIFLERLGAEFVVMAWQLATKRDEELFGTDSFIDFSQKYKAVFR